MNQTVITGNLTADIETRDLKLNGGDQHVSNFTIASNEGERVVFLPVEVWNMPHLAEYLFKGSKALVSGVLKQENWETEAGDKRSRIVLTAYRVEFLDPAPEASERRKKSNPRREASRLAGSAQSPSSGRANPSRPNRPAAARGHRAA